MSSEKKEDAPLKPKEDAPLKPKEEAPLKPKEDAPLKPKEDEPLKRRKLSCTAKFDDLWFCYSPYYQMQQYYRLGILDDCSKKWSDLFNCLKLKTKRAAEVEKILEGREKAKSHIWSFRSREEAAANWNELYGHLDDQVD